MVWFLLFIVAILGFGFMVDFMYKQIGIEHVDPRENEKHVSESERIYFESHMHNSKSYHDHGGMF
ncbi:MULTISPECIES: hypothetical protein [unclassified Bacillus (in: firmicutes)]|uniref:hypothetical protein n=1 Tax=unclassified Bacillus (in: firmicutes) TaxID=185979 RepID=UPI0008F2C3B7|nr:MULTISPECIES: hypothetical protein [unclassified Bacillus (in: firmicutes)]SFB07174.1 hypothetical protein SAMN02799634_10577 [Bacillus sp. UNCCL13]SFQ87438.1 hypothetical protein SAMN04488577_3043 [Bacillus sp. cl95]